MWFSTLANCSAAIHKCTYNIGITLIYFVYPFILTFILYTYIVYHDRLSDAYNLLRSTHPHTMNSPMEGYEYFVVANKFYLRSHSIRFQQKFSSIAL